MNLSSSSGGSGLGARRSYAGRGTNPLRVLVVAEDHDLSSVVRHVMHPETSGCAIEAVRTCEAALEAIRANKPDIVVVSVSRPVSARPDTCRRLREERCSADLPILAVSSPLESERVRALDSGADDCVSRPFGSAEFAARVRALIRRYVA